MKKAIKVIAIMLAILLLVGLWFSPWNRIPVPGYRENWPALILDCGDSGLVGTGWGGRWEVKYLSGRSSQAYACYPHPLSQDSHHKTLTLKEPTIQFEFSAAPLKQRVAISRWPTSEFGKTEARGEEVHFRMNSRKSGSFTAEKGYLYCITGVWKGGGVDYYFFTE